MPPIDPTPRSDYEHWNEERDIMWYQEVGRFASEQNEPDFDPYDDFDEEDD